MHRRRTTRDRRSRRRGPAAGTRPQALGALVRYGHFDACEDAVQEALLAAATQWPRDGLPANPGDGW